MSPEQCEKMNAMAARVAVLSDAELDALIAEDKCPYEPEHLLGEPVGMFHCPLCGEMILAGVEHPRQAEFTEKDWCAIGGSHRQWHRWPWICAALNWLRAQWRILCA